MQQPINENEILLPRRIAKDSHLVNVKGDIMFSETQSITQLFANEAWFEMAEFIGFIVDMIAIP